MVFSLLGMIKTAWKRPCSAVFFASDFDGLARLRLEDFYFWPATSDLLTKPGARLGVAVAEDECARLHLADQFQQGLAVGVRG